jgi:general secretion pathway protein D
MLSSLKQSNSRVPGRTALVLGILAFGGLAFPTLRWVAEIGFAGQPSPSGSGVPAGNEAESSKVPAVAAGPTASETVISDEYFPRPTAAEREIFEALEKPVDVSVQGMPLEKCIESLASQAKIDVWIDKVKMKEEGIAMDQPITLKLKGRRLESVLNLLFEPLQLTYIYEDEVLKITTCASAADALLTRTYPVGDLCPELKEGEDKPAPKAASTLTIKPHVQFALFQGFGGGGGGGRGGGGAAMKVTRFSNLMNAIETSVQPDSWEALSGPGSVISVNQTNSLVIRQTRSVHRGVLQLLRDLRAAKRVDVTGPGRKGGDSGKQKQQGHEELKR